MEYRKLGAQGPDVSVICMGTMTFGAPVGEADAIELTRWAVDQGINFIDTANIYEGYARIPGSPGGVAETILGKALKGLRERVVLVTKVGNPVGAGIEDKGLGRAHVLRELDKSLARMKTDHVDIYYLHKPDPATPIAETLAVFDEVIEAGKARGYGLSNFDAGQVEQILGICDAEGLRRPVVVQPPYSLLRREIEADLLPLCLREGMAVTPYQILQGGLLTGKYRRGAPLPEGSRKAERGDWVWDLTDSLFDKLEGLETEALAAGLALSDYAVRWVLRQPGVTAAVLGVKSVEQLNGLIGAAHR